MDANDVTPRMAQHLALERKLFVLRIERESAGGTTSESPEELRLMLEGERIWKQMSDEEQDRLDKEWPVVDGFPARAVAEQNATDPQFIAKVRLEELACT